MYRLSENKLNCFNESTEEKMYHITRTNKHSNWEPNYLANELKNILFRETEDRKVTGLPHKQHTQSMIK